MTQLIISSMDYSLAWPGYNLQLLFVVATTNFAVILPYGSCTVISFDVCLEFTELSQLRIDEFLGVNVKD